MEHSGPDAHLRALFESLPTAVLVANDEGRYVDANAAACDLLGRPREEVVGAIVADIVSPARPDELAVQWQSFLRDGEQSGFIDVNLPDGRTRTVRFRAFANFVPGLHCSFLSPKRGEGTPGETPDDESALTLCAWTRRVRHQGQWISFEDYLLAAHGQQVSHGISPDAFQAFTEGDEEDESL